MAAVVNVLASSLALVCIYHLYKLNAAQRRYTGLFRFLFLLVACHLLFDFQRLPLSYINANITPLFEKRIDFTFQFDWLISEVVTWTRRYCLLRIAAVFLGRELPGKLLRWLLLTGAGFLLFVMSLFVFPELLAYWETVDFSLRILLGLIEAAAMLILLVQAKKKKETAEGLLLRWFALINLVCVVFAYLYMAWGRHPGRSLLLHLLFDFLFQIVVNIGLLVWLWFFLRPWLAGHHSPQPRTGRVDWEELGLSGREKEILDLILEGKSNLDIADRLFVSEHTIKNTITGIYVKLGVANRKELFHRFLAE